VMPKMDVDVENLIFQSLLGFSSTFSVVLGFF